MDVFWRETEDSVEFFVEKDVVGGESNEVMRAERECDVEIGFDSLWWRNGRENVALSVADGDLHRVWNSYFYVCKYRFF